MKKAILFSCIITICFSFAACTRYRGDVKNVEIDYGSSDKFSESEIESAVNCVLDSFKEADGCKLLKLWYDEEKSNSQIGRYVNDGVEEANVIIIFSDYKTDSTHITGPNQTFNNWMSILIRNNPNDEWRIDDSGY